MTEFYAKGDAVFQAPVTKDTKTTMGFCVCVCDQVEHAAIVAATLNQHEAAKRWRRAFHHGTRDEIELQEQCLLDALETIDSLEER